MLVYMTMFKISDCYIYNIYKSITVVVVVVVVVTPIVEVCNCSMFCFSLLYVHSSIAFILMGKRELVALLNLSS